MLIQNDETTQQKCSNFNNGSVISIKWFANKTNWLKSDENDEKFKPAHQ